MMGRHIAELIILIILICIGTAVKLYTKRLVKGMEDSGTIIKGKDAKGKIIDGRDEKEKAD